MCVCVRERERERESKTDTELWDVTDEDRMNRKLCTNKISFVEDICGFV